MSTRPLRVPGPDHPISIEPNPRRVTVTVGGHTVADTQRALSVREANYPVVHYIPREDVDMTQLRHSSHVTYCPYKGDCTYYDVPIGGSRAANAAWTYASPHEAVAAIAGCLAFYPDRVGAITER